MEHRKSAVSDRYRVPICITRSIESTCHGKSMVYFENLVTSTPFSWLTRNHKNCMNFEYIELTETKAKIAFEPWVWSRLPRTDWTVHSYAFLPVTRVTRLVVSSQRPCRVGSRCPYGYFSLTVTADQSLERESFQSQVLWEGNWRQNDKRLAASYNASTTFPI